MLEIKELEEKWKVYNRRKKRPLYILLILILAIGGVGIYTFFNQDTLGSKLKEFKSRVDFSRISNIFKSDIKEEVLLNKVDSSKIVKKSQYILNSPILTLQSASDTKKEVELSSKKVENSLDDDAPIDSDDLYVEKDIIKPLVNKKPLNIIKVTNNQNAYRDVERRFKRTHNINDAMFLASMYYKKRNYRKAIYWSMKTNKLDRNIDESWLIFAKSKVKLGKKNEAMKVLRAYIKRSNSYEAKKLLKKLIKS
ncbi:MAG: CDC27 family protein [Campylobacterales bacterium]